MIRQFVREQGLIHTWISHCALVKVPAPVEFYIPIFYFVIIHRRGEESWEGIRAAAGKELSCDLLAAGIPSAGTVSRYSCSEAKSPFFCVTFVPAALSPGGQPIAQLQHEPRRCRASGEARRATAASKPSGSELRPWAGLGGPGHAPARPPCFCAGAESAAPPRGTAHILGTSAARDVLRRINAVAPVVGELLS